MPSHSRAVNSVAAIVGAALILAGMTAHSRAAQVDIMLVKTRHAVQGFGNLFYKGERYRIQIEGIVANSLKSQRTNLAGSVENMYAASDILGTYEPAELGGNAIVDNNDKPVRIKNKHGVILEVHGVNLGGLSLDLAGMTVTSRGWGPDAKERARH
jgi:hypothetical protein